MLHDPTRVEATLAALVGRPLWKAVRAADMLGFHGDGIDDATPTPGAAS